MKKSMQESFGIEIEGYENAKRELRTKMSTLKEVSCGSSVRGDR